MAGGNGDIGVAIVYARLPTELRSLVEIYQNNRRIATFSAALKELLETHPALAEIVEGVYAAASQVKE